MNSGLQVTITAIIIVILFLAILRYDARIHNKAIEDKNDTMRYYNSKPEDIIGMINFILDLELAYQIELPFEGKDIKRITDFEDCLHSLTTNTVDALSPEFFKRANATGFNDDYLLEYITRGATTRIMKYMKDNNAGYISGNDEDMG